MFLDLDLVLVISRLGVGHMQVVLLCLGAL